MLVVIGRFHFGGELAHDLRCGRDLADRYTYVPLLGLFVIVACAATLLRWLYAITTTGQPTRKPIE